MSRIQEILARAERDGTVSRTRSTGSSAPAPAPTPLAPQPVVHPRGHSAAPIEAEPFTRTGVPAWAAVPAGAAQVETDPPSAAGGADARVAVATLHPLLVAAIDPHSEAAEQYRTLRARLSHREETTPIRTLIVTSPGARDGKSLTAANLALTMAQEFQRSVLLADTDFRGSSLHSLFGLDASPGLAELLNGDASLDDVMVYMPDYRLTVIPAGQTPPFPTELLGSTAMRRVVDTLRARFDRVLFDMPAVMPLADVGTFAPLADGVLMVVRAGVTQRPALNQALSAFDDEKVLGVVLNGTN